MSKLLATDVLSGNQLRKELRLQSADVTFLNSCSETKVPASSITIRKVSDNTGRAET